MAAPSSWVKEGTVASLPRDTTWRRPDESVGDERMLSGIAGDIDSGLCFLFRNSSAPSFQGRKRSERSSVTEKLSQGRDGDIASEMSNIGIFLSSYLEVL